MKLKKFVIFLFIIGATVSLGLNIRQGNKASLFSKKDSYSILWKRVDSCEKKGLTESAAKIVEEIYSRAKADNNASQFVKSFIYKMKLAQYKEEFSQEKNINSLVNEVNATKFPIKPVLQSILADAYWQYYQANRWKFYNRSETINFNVEDIATYDLKTLIRAAVFNYEESLKDTIRLKQTKIDLFEEIVTPGAPLTRLWRPTLYDFLAHRALDFFKNSEADISKAANQFHTNEIEYLQPFPQFLSFQTLKTDSTRRMQDSSDLRYQAVKLFKDLLQFQLKTGNEAGLLDLEMERLAFFYSQSKNQLKDTFYLETIKWFVKRFENNSRVAEIKHMEAEWWLTKSNNYKPLEGDQFKWCKRKSLAICNDIIKNHKNSRGAQMAFNTRNSILLKSLSLTVEQVNDHLQPNRILINYNNLSKIYFKVFRTDYFEYQKILNKQYESDVLPQLLKLPSALSFEETMPADQDYNPHAIEVKVPPLDLGYYVLIASDSPEFRNKESVLGYQLYVVSNLAYLNKRKTSGGYDFYVLNRLSGKAVKNAVAQLWHNNYNSLTNTDEFTKGKSYQSDNNGYFSIDGVENSENSFFVELTYEKDKLFSPGDFYNYKDYENNTVVTKSFIFTDRAIYRPGQTIYFKSIPLKNLKKKTEIQPKHPVTLTLYDVNHQRISSQDLITNDYGTVSGSFVAPMTGLSGQMEITDGHGSVFISVEEYKKPKFETLFDTLKGSYQLEDMVSIKGFAKAYAGNVIDNAKVKYRVVRNINYPNWWYWYKPYYNRSSAMVEITNGTLKTDELGYFEIKFKALADPTADKKENPSYTFQIFADVTDVNGETRSAQANFNVGYKQLELNFSCPDVVNTNALTKMSITASNLNGVEEFVTGQLTAYALKQPEKVFRSRLWAQPDQHIYSKETYYQLFPNDLYEDENNQFKWERSKIVFTRNFNTKLDKNIVMDEFKKLNPGVYLIEGTCKDKSGAEVKSMNYVTVYNPLSPELPMKSALWSYGIQETAEPGENGIFIVASSYNDLNCLYEVEGENRKETKFIAPSLKPLEVGIDETDRGGVSATTTFIKNGRFYSSAHYIKVPFTNKELSIEYSTFRNKLLPGEKEEWTLTIKNKKGDPVAAEMLAALYDASLDALKPNDWYFGIYNAFYPRSNWAHSLENVSNSFQLNGYSMPYKNIDELLYDQLNYFGLNYYSGGYYGWGASEIKRSTSVRERQKERANNDKLEESELMPPMAASMETNVKSRQTITHEDQLKKSDVSDSKSIKDLSPVSARKNFNETAFFYPQLNTNEKGEVLIRFTIPESLTKWKFMGFAHTKDLSYGQTKNEVLTQKELMLVPNAPRFFREGDRMTFVSKVSNLSANKLNGNAEIKFYDAVTGKEISKQLLLTNDALKTFDVEKGQSTTIDWQIKIPEGIQAIQYNVVAKAGNFSDGEQMVIPVLTNRMLVTESMPLPIRGNQSKEFTFSKFINQNNGSSTLKNHAYTLEFTANPAWYAVQSLPYLMEYPYECAEQTFARYYANALASFIANSKPKIKQIFDSWKTKSSESFLSNLEKNQELKSLLLEETPWVLDAKNESENKKRIALLFDLNKMSNELSTAITKLEKMQTANGAWPWFAGGTEDWYISQYIVTGLAHLQKLGVINIENDPRISKIVNSALAFCDSKLEERYKQGKRNNKNFERENHLDQMVIQYLYMRSYFKDAGSRGKDAFVYYKKQAQKYWLSNNRHLQAMIALALNRYGDKKTSGDILRSLKENALNSEEMGMYWKENYGGYYWYQAPIEMQALMIEAFDEVAQDLKAVDDLKTWLIKSKQTQNWSTTRATSEAVYALLLRGGDWLSVEPNVEISLGALNINPQTDPEIKSEAGTGYFKKTFTGSDIVSAMGKVKIRKKDAGVSWGAVYWQYFEQLDKITPHETPLKINKKLFVEVNTTSGPVITPVTESSNLKFGDKIRVRIELRVDRDMEYVHLKDMRAAGFEPLNVLSTYRYQDGLGYYESTKDAATHFFISYLPKGTFIFEYPLVLTHSGDFSNGISSIQCMYAPEFTSHSEGLRVKIGK